MIKVSCSMLETSPGTPVQTCSWEGNTCMNTGIAANQTYGHLGLELLLLLPVMTCAWSSREIFMC